MFAAAAIVQASRVGPSSGVGGGRLESVVAGEIT